MWLQNRTVSKYVGAIAPIVSPNDATTMNATKNRWVKNVCVFFFPFTIANVAISYRNPIVVLLGLIDRLARPRVGQRKSLVFRAKSISTTSLFCFCPYISKQS